MKRKSKSKTSRRRATCVVFDKTLKRSLKEQAAREERPVSSIVSEASQLYLKQKREEQREEREQRAVEN
ncbi:MAG: hypothetical protein WBZ36_26140 [Candidatus Nitrosopolaris sp.]